MSRDDLELGKFDLDGRLRVAGATEDAGVALYLEDASADVESDDQINSRARGVKVVIDITGIKGKNTALTVTIQGKDVISGKYYPLLKSLPLSATGLTVLTVYPGAARTTGLIEDDALPYVWRVHCAIEGTKPKITATLGACLLG